MKESVNLELPIICEQCGWYGRLSEATQSEVYAATNTTIHFICPDCECDVYTFVEDKLPDDSANCEEGDGLPPMSPERLLVGTQVEDDV